MEALTALRLMAINADTRPTPAPSRQVPAQASTADTHEPENYADARYAALDQMPLSDSAKAMAEALAQQIENNELQNNIRKRRRDRRGTAQLEEVIARLTADLLASAGHRPSRWSYLNLDSTRYSGAEVSFRAVKAAHEGMKRLTLTEVLPGYYERDPGFQHGKATRLRGTGAFFTLCRQYGLTPEAVGDHFYRGLPSDPLVVKAASKRRGGEKYSGRRLTPGHSDAVQQLRRDVQEVNTFLDNVTMEGGTHKGYLRIFNEGDQPDFNWNKGGRLFSVGQDNYQRMKKNQRQRMRLNGEPVVEIDVKASYLTILYALHGQQLDHTRDPYDVPEVERNVVKQWVTMTLGHHTFHKRWPKDAKQELEKDVGRLRFTAPQVQERVLERHPILSDWPDQKTSCFDLMFLESEAVVNTILRLKREHGVPCLSVHDSIIVPAANKNDAMQALGEEYRSATTAKPVLEVNPP